MVPLLPIEEEYLLTDLETLKILSDPLRLQILEQIRIINDRGRAAVVKELAKALSMPPTKLYYHVNLLEEHELIRVVETRLVSGILEKRYQVRARRIRAELDLEGEPDSTGEEKLELVLSSLSAIFNKTQDSLRQSYRHLLRSAGRERLEGALETSEIDILHTTLSCNADQAREFRQKLQELVESYLAAEPSPTDKKYKLTVVFHPAYHLNPSEEEPGHGDTIL
ncbi:MAG: helix-turn-helix domain-containing protein [Anaerolineales bacterium]|jgi:DNA-binding transcriptional ArsR family regulator